MTFQRILSEEERGCVALGQRLDVAAVVTPSIRKTTINFQLKIKKKHLCAPRFCTDYTIKPFIFLINSRYRIISE